MDHNFENLASVLNRCSAQVADQVIAEIRIAIHEATNGSLTPDSLLSKMAMRVRKPALNALPNVPQKLLNAAPPRRPPSKLPSKPSKPSKLSKLSKLRWLPLAVSPVVRRQPNCNALQALLKQRTTSPKKW